MGARGVREAGWIVGIGLAAAFLVKLALTLWALDRGYEMGDEGYFLLNLNHPADAPGVFQFYRLLGLLGGELRFDAIAARGLRIVVELLGSLALVGGVFAWARARVFEPGAVGFPGFLGFCLLGTLLTVGSRALSYNDMANLCTYAAVGSLFALASLPASAAARRARSLAALGAGLATGLQFTVKFPPAFLLVAGSIGVLAGGFRRLPAAERARLGAFYAAGLAAVALLLVALHGGPAALLAQYEPMPEFARLSGYQPASIVARYVETELLTLLHIVVLGGVFGAGFSLLRRLGSLGTDAALAGALAGAALYLVVGVRALRPFFLEPTLLYLSAFLGFALLACAGRAWRRDRGARLLPLLALVALPVVNLAGTNVPLSMRLPSHVLPWFVAIGVVLLDLRARSGLVRVHTLASVLGIALTSVLFVHHHLERPYGLAQPIREQRRTVDGLTGLRVDAETARFLEAVASRMEEAGFRRGDAVFALDYMPGLVAFLGGTSPGSTFYMFDKPELNCFNLNRARYEGAPWFILGRPMSAAQSACLQGIDFERDFRLIGTMAFPYEEVYASFDAPGLSRIYLYGRDPTGAPEGRESR